MFIMLHLFINFVGSLFFLYLLYLMREIIKNIIAGIKKINAKSITKTIKSLSIINAIIDETIIIKNRTYPMRLIMNVFFA
jgi:hypothetical protein